MPLDSHSNVRSLNNRKRILNTSPNIGGFGRPALCLFLILAATFALSSASLAGSYVISHAPSGTVNQPVSYMEVTFSEEINGATFTTDDITFTDPGTSLVTVDPPVDQGNNVWRIDLAEQSADGEYQLTIGTYIENMAGVELDESYTGSFTIDTTPPPEITNLIVNTLGDGNSAVLDWSGYDEAGAGDVAYYRIYVETSDFSDIPETEFATVSAGQFTFAATGLNKGETYFFAVVAVDHAGNAVTEVTTPPPSGILTDTELPEPVTNLQVDCTETALAFTWDHSSNSAGDLANYQVYFEGDPTGVQVASTQNSYEVTGLNPASGYEFAVTAIDNDGNESMPASTTGVTLLDNPINLTAASSYGRVDLNWSSVSSPELVKYYAVYMSQSPFTSVEGMTQKATAYGTFASIGGLSNDVTYYFAVTAVNLSEGETKDVYAVSAMPVSVTRVSGEIKSNTTWTAANSPYLVTGDITVRRSSYSYHTNPGSAKLTIEPGVQIRFDSGTGLYVGKAINSSLGYFGALSVQGTAESPVTFTSNAALPAPGDWKGIYFRNETHDAATLLEYCIVEYGGHTHNANMYFASASPAIKNSTIRRSSSNGIYLNASSPKISSSIITNNTNYGISCNSGSAGYITDNSFSGNVKTPINIHPNAARRVSGNSGSGNGRDVIRVYGGELTANSTWVKQALPFVIAGDITVRRSSYSYHTNPGSVKLTIKPGVQIRFDPGTGLIVGKAINSSLGYFGALSVQGTAESPVTFTSNAASPAPGDWKGIYFRNETHDAATLLEYCIVEYGGHTHNANMYFASASPAIKNSTIRRSSSNGIYLNTSSPTISNNTIIDNSNYGISCNSSSVGYITDNSFSGNVKTPINIHPNAARRVSGNSGSGNGRDVIRVYGGELTANSTWVKQALPFVIAGDITVRRSSYSYHTNPGSVKLTIKPGVQIRFDPGTGLIVGKAINSSLGYFGALSVQGTAESPVTFTSNAASPAPGDWKGIYFRNETHDAATLLEYCIVEYGGHTHNANMYFASANPVIKNSTIRSSSSNGIYLSNSSPTINNTSIEDNSNYGIFCNSSSAGYITDNSFSGNVKTPINIHPNAARRVSGNSGSGNGRDVIRVYGGELTANSTWVKQALPFVIAGDITVRRSSYSYHTNPGSVKLTIEPGVQIRFDPGTGLIVGKAINSSLGYYGALSVQGTAESPVTFTSNAASPAPGDWKGIYFRNETHDAYSMLEHCIVEYGGHTNNADIYLANTKPTIQYNTIRNSSHSGIIANNTGSNGAVINCNNFKDNLYGVYTTNNARPIISQNNFLRNQNYGVYNNGSSVNAVNNWWGDPNGPNTNGDGTYGNVNYTPWLVAESDCISTPPTNSPPFTPKNPSPSNDAVRVPVLNEGVPIDLTIGWAGGDPNPWDTVVYDVYLGTDPDSLPLVAASRPTSDYAASGLDEGTTYYWKIVSRDNGAGGLETAGPVWHFTTLGAPPDLEVTNVSWEPETGIQAGQTVTFTAIVANSGSGPVVDTFQVKFEISGSSISTKTVSSVIPSGDTVQVSRTWTAVTGDFSITVTADSSSAVLESFEENNSFTVALPHVTDPTPPEVVSTQPGDGAAMQEVTAVVISLYDQYGVVDDAAVIAGFDVRDSSNQQVAGSVAESNDTFTFTPSVAPDSLPNGAYTVSYTAADEEGNTRAYSFAFTVDSQPPDKPTITGGTVTSGLIQGNHFNNQSNSAAVTLSGAREDNTSAWLNGSQRVAAGTGDWSLELNLSQGDNAIEIHVMDLAGNVSPSEFVDIFVDSVAPAIASITPANDSFLTAAPAEVLIGFTEATSGLDWDNTARSIKNSGDVEINGTWTLEEGNQVKFVPAAGFADSVYTVSIQPTDNIGNQGPAAIYQFTVDTQAPAKPTITGGSVTSGVIQIAPVINESNTTGVTLTGTREDNTSVWINGSQQVAAGTGDWSTHLTLSQGDNSLTITLKDPAGNESDPATVLILVDSVAPAVTGVTPADNSIQDIKPSNVIIGFTETTTSLDLIGSTHLVRDNSFALVPGTWSVENDNQLVFIPQSSFEESVYTISIQLKDQFGNQGALYQYIFTVDTIAPEAPVVTPVESPTHNPTQVISGTREAYAAILMNGQEIVGHEAGSTWSHTVSLSSGSNMFTLAAKDRAGNMSPDVTVEIVFDDVAPLPVTTLTVGGEGVGTSVTLNWTGYNESEHGDIASYKIYMRESAFSNVTDSGVSEIGSVSAGTFTYQAGGLTAGSEYFFAIVAIDLRTNYRTDVISVSGTPLDTAAPSDVTNLTTNAPEAGKLVFSWDPSPSDDLARYRVCFAAEDCLLLEGPTPATSFEKTGLSPASAYPFMVYAQDAADNESGGVSVTGYTLLDNPTGLIATAHSGKVDLTWNPASPGEYVKHYAVYASQSDFVTVEGLTPALTTAGTAAQVAGLTNNSDYYFAVTTVNKSDGETKTVATVMARPVPDSEGPEITNVMIGVDALTEGYIIKKSASVTLTATDSSGVSRVEFSIDGSLIRTDYTGPEYSGYIDISNLEDGSHTFTIAAYDTLGNMTTDEYNFNVAMAVPKAPTITQPASGVTVNQSEITISGYAEKFSTVTIYRNDAISGESVEADMLGNFSTGLPIVEGQNKIEAAAQNRAGTGPKSDAVYVTLNTAIPSAPTNLAAETRSGGQIRLAWQTPSGGDIDGYNIYRNSLSFSTTADAVKVNSNLITGTSYDNLPSSDGTWYYRVTAVSEAGNESRLSEEAQAVSDSIGPRAASIQYTPQGNVDPVNGAMAPGRLDILLTVSEPLQSDPFFTITPEGGVPISVDLTNSADLTYTGFITITESTPTARAWAVFSARDVAGNRGTVIDEGQSILIDTDGPAVSRLVVLPLSPIQNDQQDPVSLLVTAGLSEKSKAGSVIELGYLLPSQGTGAISIDAISRIETQSGDAETWQAAFTLPADAGFSGVETLVFTYTGEDDLGNVSHEILSDNQFQVYQGDLPPLAVPTGLTGAALSGGRIRLAWNAVEGAVAYQLYRKTQDETELTAYARIDSGLEYIDELGEDGLYTYAVASIRRVNEQESASGMSNPVTVGSDSEAPPAPTNLVLDLISQGIRANWTASATAEDVTYAFYRAATDTTPLADAVLVKDGFSQTSWIDFNPSGSKHYYLVTAIDDVGNESAPCTPVYLDFALLPVSGITVVQEDYSLPVITWTHPEAGSVDGYDLYLGAVEDGVKLNSGLLTSRTFTDVGYAGDARTYTLVAVSDNNDSLPRSLTLPQLSAALDESVRLKRGLMNRLDFMVQNSSAVAVGNIALKLAVDGRNHTSESFSLQAGESAVIPVVVGGYDDLPDVADMTATLEIKPNSGETVKIIRTSVIEVEDGMLVLRIFNEEFTRGATGKIGFSLENTGEEEIEILTARNTNKSASDQITFYLKDEDGNTLATAAFKQTIGDYITGLANGNTVARIPAGETFTADLITMNVPINAPDTVYIRLSISKIYHHQGQTDQVSMSGLSTTYDIYLIDTSYYGAVDDITPQVSSGGEDIIISGRAVERSTGDPLPGVPLNLVVTVSGFERTYEVYTDDAGLFTHAFKPLKNEAGKYTVRAVHPDLRNRPVHGSFVISRVSVSPATVNLNISRNYRKSVNVKVATSKGTSLTDVRLVYKAADQPGGEFPRGVTLTVGGPKNIGSGGYVNLPFTIWADNTAAAVNTLYLKVVSGAAGETGHGTVRINAGFYDAKPVLNFTPNSVVTGLAWDDTVVETLTLKNSGLGDLTDVTLSLHNTDGSSAPAWIYLNSAADQGTIATGASRKIDIAFSPTQARVAEGNYTYYLKVASANYATRNIYLSVAVTQSGQGDALFKISDIYTGTLDHNNQPVQGLKGAKIKVQNEEVTTEITVKTTDSLGEAMFSDLPAGRYKYRITAANHIEQIGRFWVKPGVIVNQEVFLDYNLVSVEWEVNETTIEDKYEITLNTTFETDVPVAVVVVSPASVTLPKMQAGDVFNGEFTLTNHGLIRADDIKVSLPPSDSHFKYEILGGVPTSLQAKQRITIPYRITCLTALEPEEEGTGGGCRSYQTCITISYGCTCVNGQYVQNLGRTCFTRIYDCTSSDGSVPVIIGGGGTVSVGGGAGGGGSTSKPAPKPKTISGVKCFPEPVRKERFCLKCWVKDTVANILHPVGSYVNTVMREYHREDVDLSVKVPGGTVEIKRWFYGNQWLWEHERNRLSFKQDSLGTGIESIDKGGVIYQASSGDGNVFIHDVFRIIKQDDTYRWEDTHGGWKAYDEFGRVTSYGARTDVVARLLYESGENGKLIGVADRNDTQVLWYEYNTDGLISAVYDGDNRRVEYTYTGGRLSGVKDVLNNTAGFEYDSKGRLNKTIDAEGRYKTITYDGYGNVASVVDSQGEGSFFEYDYDEAGKETFVRITSSAGKIKEVWYDRDGETKRVDINGRTVQKIAKDGRDLLITDEQGNVTRKEYDEWDNLTKVINPDGTFVATQYEHKFNKRTRQTDENGIVTEYEYDDSGNLNRKVEAAGTEYERVTEYTYDEDGNLLTTKRLANANTAEALTVMIYDTAGNLTSITDPEGGVTGFTSHDVMGNVLTKIDARGKQWTYEYDAAGRLTAITDPIVNAVEPLRNVTRLYYDAVGNKIRQVDPRGKETLYEYDENNNLTLVTDPLGNQTGFEYNADNKLVRQIDAEGKQIHYEYDLDGRLLKTIDGNNNEIAMEYADGTGSGCSSCAGAGGAANQPSRITYPTFAKEFGYDTRGRKIIEKDVLSGTETYSTNFGYDPAGNLVSRTDKEEKITGYEYDALNRLAKVTDPLSKATHYTYDNRDNLMALTDAENNITWFEYDRNNRLVKEIRPEGQETTYQYDAAGNLIRKTDTKNQETGYDYDDAGRLVQIHYFEAADHVNPVKTVTFSYDSAGNLTGYNDGITSATYTYDDLYRKLSETVNYGPFEQANSYSYYNNGLKKTFTGPNSVTYAYTYDNNNQLTGVNIPGAGYITYSSYTWNRPKEVILPGGSKREYAYDPLMRVKSIAAKDPGQNILLNYQYNYDKMDNITAKATEHGGYDYGYDDLYRLTGADNPVQADEGFTYDAVGNRLTAAGVADNWSYSDNNELQGYDDVTFEYDANGNMTKKTDAGQVTNYIYNIEDRLERVEDGSGSLIAQYYYDPFGRRLWKEVNGVRTYFVYSDEDWLPKWTRLAM